MATTTRSTRSATALLSENTENTMKTTVKNKKANVENKPVNGKKRKAYEDVEDVERGGKRAALGEITNKNQKGGSSSGSNIAVKGGNFIAGLLRKSLRRGGSKKSTDASAVKALVSNIETEGLEDKSYGESESSTEILGCVLESSADNTSSNNTTSSSIEAVLNIEDLPQDFTVISPPRPVMPEGVEDYDLLTKGDPAEVAEYAQDIFQYYKTRETRFCVSDYMRHQADLTTVMRAILVDWMVEVQESFELNHETLYAAVKIVDIYLSRKKVTKDSLQLVGATALLLSSKVEELMPPLLSDFVYVCDDAYSADDILRMERRMLKVVGFDIGFPLSYSFLRRYAKVCKVGVRDLTFARYILETSLLHYDLNIDLSPSMLAVSALVLVFKIQGITNWETSLEFYSGYKVSDMSDTVLQLHAMLNATLPQQVQTVRSKYSHKVFHRVATIPIPSSIQC